MLVLENSTSNVVKLNDEQAKLNDYSKATSIGMNTWIYIGYFLQKREIVFVSLVSKHLHGIFRIRYSNYNCRYMEMSALYFLIMTLEYMCLLGINSEYSYFKIITLKIILR